MTAPTTTFTCNICGEESTRICARCTKDTCNNHLCEKCLRCSDCCECEITRDESVRPVVRPPAEAITPVAEEAILESPLVEEPTLEAPPEVAVEGAPVPDESPEPDQEVAAAAEDDLPTPESATAPEETPSGDHTEVDEHIE
jgi:hypothetical protein